MANAVKKATSGKAFTEASKKKRGALGNWFGFFASSKKWWLMPMIAVLLVLALLFVLSSTVVAPFIYTLF